jgi:hemoglobin
VSLPSREGRSLKRATVLKPERDYREDQEKMSSLYDRLGGEKAVNAAVENFYRRVLSDGRIARFFEGVDMDSQIAKQKSFLIMAFGGPNKYTGADMRNAHKKLVDKGLNDSHVDAVIENLNTTLRELGVPETEVKEVAAIANSVRNDVLGR